MIKFSNATKSVSLIVNDRALESIEEVCGRGPYAVEVDRDAVRVFHHEGNREDGCSTGRFADYATVKVKGLHRLQVQRRNVKGIEDFPEQKGFETDEWRPAANADEPHIVIDIPWKTYRSGGDDWFRVPPRTQRKDKIVHNPPVTAELDLPAANGDGRIGQTLRLDQARWQRLKILAATRSTADSRVTAHDLIVEGVEMVLDKYADVPDALDMLRRLHDAGVEFEQRDGKLVIR